ncbi:MAG: molybdopterin molybdotransferase MoeA [Planctomycetota bacterium]
MLPFEKAFETVLKSAGWLGTESIDITNALNRILAEDVKSDMDIPPFNKSTMDGFACRRIDLANELTVIETIPAGYIPRKVVGINQCSKIMTGGVVPDGADCVIMKEYVENLSENTVRFVGDETFENICRKAEDVKAGEIVLRKGIKLKSQHIAVLASAGKTQLLVANRPNIAVIATGNELVEPASKPQLSQIRDSNSYQLAAKIESIGAVTTNYGIAGDTTGEIDSVFKKAVSQNDVVIISGGVSVGDFDFVPKIFKQNEVNILFEKILIKPGKPTVFGVSEKVYCFGLPGNPVSTFVVFEILVKPFLYKLMGHDYKPLNIQMPLDEHLIDKKAERQRWLPVTITDKGTVKPVEYHGSAHINSLCGAEGLISIDIGVTEIEKGTSVAVRLI